MLKRLWGILVLFILAICIFTFMLFSGYIPYHYGLLITLFLIAVLVVDNFRHKIHIKDRKKFARDALIILASSANFTGVFISKIFWDLDILAVLAVSLVLSFFAGLLLEDVGKSIFGACFSLVLGGLMASLIIIFPLLVQGEDFLIVQYYFWSALQEVAPVFILALSLMFLGTLSANILQELFK